MYLPVPLLVAHCDVAPVGFILVHPRGVAGSPYIGSIAVVEEVRGRRVGSELLRFAEELFRREANHIFLPFLSLTPALARSTNAMDIPLLVN